MNPIVLWFDLMALMLLGAILCNAFGAMLLAKDWAVRKWRGR